MEEGVAETIPIVRVEGEVELWFMWDGSCWTFTLAGVSRPANTQREKDACLLELVRELFDKKIGYLASRWNDVLAPKWKDRLPIEYEHAKVKLGDVFDYYTTSDGVLQVPKWKNFKYAVEEYLENDPRIKYHPSRVREFISERGIEQLGEMT